MAEAALRLHDVSIGYQGKPVVEHITFTVEQGEFVAITGPNGSGKTTLMRALLGLTPTMTGRIDYRSDPRKHPWAYVPQRDSLDPIFPLSAMDVVLMGTYSRLPPLVPIGGRLRRLAAECLDRVGMSQSSRRLFHVLSGGQRQRVLVARALATQAQIMALDEPTAGIDVEAEAAIIVLLTQLNRDQGMTILMVTHHLQRITAHCTSLVRVDAGRAIKFPAADLAANEPQSATPTARSLPP